jgi:predicted negative regulator of RcsB-dependent stress response
MAYYDLDEQEQLSALKAWWNQWGALMIAGIGLALAAVAAYQGWVWYKRDQATNAAVLYTELTKFAQEKFAQEGDKKKANERAEVLIEKYPNTGYAPLAALVAARLSFEGGDLPSAKQNLQWVIDKARDEEFKSVARLRLAGILLDEKRFDEALKLLDINPDASMANLYADLRGDLFMAKGSLAEARSAYQSALEKTDAKSPYRSLIQLKIDSLGEAK